jgi:hypothetical protein
MSDGLDLVSVLYRADWTRLSLAAEVRDAWDRDLYRSWFSGRGPVTPPRGPGGGPRSGPGGGPPPEESWEKSWEEEPPRRLFGIPRRPPWTGREWEMATDQLGTETGRSALLIAPGGRYRHQGESFLSGCDGERSWLAVRDHDGWSIEAAGEPEPPLPPLLRPSWLLAGFTLESGGPVTAGGRDALRVVATPRPGLWASAGSRSPGGRPLDRVEAVVDTELGILLRCAEILDGRPLSVTELTDVRVDPDPETPAADDVWCQPPDGWDSVEEDVPGSTPDGPGRDVAKLVAGLAAGGLGALIRSVRFRPFEQATREEPEAEMPAPDGPAPADEPPATGEVLRLLHSGPDRWAPGIAATLHEWHDIAAMLAQIPDGARRAGFGGLGFLVDTASDRIATLHMVSRLHLGGPGQYRIEPILRPGMRRLETIVCDGERRWRIGADRATAGPATPPPREVADLFDASWLLESRLSDGAETVVGGRRGYRLRVASELPGRATMFDSDDVIVDAELGIMLRSVSHAGSRPVSRYELHDVVLGPGDFRPEIPLGARVTDESADVHEPRFGRVNLPAKLARIIARQAAGDARSAVRSFLGVIRGEDER